MFDAQGLGWCLWLWVIAALVMFSSPPPFPQVRTWEALRPSSLPAAPYSPAHQWTPSPTLLPSPSASHTGPQMGGSHRRRYHLVS
jgi:hypothetical protein